MRMLRNPLLRLAATAAIAAAALDGAASAGVLFSYDPSSGQFPTDQGWLAFDIDADGPLTEPNASGAATDYANAAIEEVDGLNVLHIRDTLTDDEANLPLYYYPWTAAQQTALLNRGIRFAMEFQGLATTTGGKGNVRFGFNDTRFEAEAANIDADNAIQVLGLSAELAPGDGAFHTLQIVGDWNGPDFEFSYIFDDAAPVPIDIITNPSPGDIESSLYFGASASGGRGTDILVKSVSVETLRVPEPGSLLLVIAAAGVAAVARRRRR